MTQPAAPLSESKTCTKCGETKPLDEFPRDKSRRDGRHPYCKSCGRAYRRAYREEHLEEVRRRENDYYWRNRESVLASQKAARREYYAANRDRIAERVRAYYRDNPHVWWASKYRSRARSFSATPVVEDFTKPDVIARYGDSCFYCDGPFEHLDHAIPISKGGPHTLANVRPSCAECNVVKHDRTPEEWQAEQDATADLTPEELDALIDAEVRRWSTNTTNQGEKS